MPPVAPHVLVIEGWIPTSTNALLSRHWGTRSRLKRSAIDAVAVAAFLANPPVPRATGRRRVHVAVTTAGRGGIPDGDNVLKVLFDACKANGLIVDDSSEWLELGRVTVGRGAERGTVLIFEDIGS